jgi:ABC-type nitrate/sulfonate/bicarbonate transport system substrate-binding protein
MPVMQDRRRFLATLSSTAAAGLLHIPNVLGQEAPLETTRIRLYDWTGLCIAPQFVAEELLNAEGFTDVQYVRAEPTGQLPSRDINFVTYPANQSMQLLADSKIDASLSFPPVPQELRAKKIGHVIVNSSVDRPWSQYFCCMISANREFVHNHPVATKRAMRALLKAVDVCVTAPERAARIVADRGYTYDYSLQAIREIPYAKWRNYDPEDAIRFYALRLRDAGMIKSSPNKILADGADWRFWNELKRELKA